MREMMVRVLSLLALGSLAAVGLQLEPRVRRTLADEPRQLQSPTAVSPAAVSPAEDKHPLDPAIETAREGLAYLRRHVRDYSAILVKRERVSAELGEHQFINVKVRRRWEENGQVVPFSVYLHFLQPKSVKGREVIWVEGRNNNKLVAHEGGFKNLLRVHLKPEHPLAMFGQRYPISEIGLENLIVQLIKKGERDRAYGECQVRFIKQAKVSGRVCTAIEVVHPVKRSHFDFYRARIFIDDELHVPIRYAAWSWPAAAGDEPPLEEEYTYTNLQLNVGLTDADFAPDNPQYNYP